MKFMLSALLILYSCIISCGNSKSKSNCEKFRTGKFILQLDVPPYSYTIIERNDSLQIETNSTTKDTVINSVKWTGPCEYELKLLNRNKKDNDSLTLFFDQKIFKSKILEAKNDYYIFKMYIEGIEFSYIDTLRVMSMQR